MNNIERAMLIIIFVLSLFAAAFSIGNMILTEKVLDKEEQIQQTIEENNSFSEVELIALLKKYNIQHKDIVLAQAILESSYFTSNLFVKQNNMFGMLDPLTRPTTSIGDKKFANYNTIEEGVIDYALWQSCYARNLTREEYFNKLSEVYAEDKNYVNKLKNIIKKYER